MNGRHQRTSSTGGRMVNRNPEKRWKSQQRYRESHKEEIIERQRKFRKSHRLEIRADAKRYYYENRERILDQNRAYAHNRKKEVLTYYGNGKLACVHCGFSDVRALSVDHINGGGVKHRRELSKGKTGINFYRWLKRHNYPEEYQTLCMNCQWIKRDEKNENRIIINT